MFDLLKWKGLAYFTYYSGGASTFCCVYIIRHILRLLEYFWKHQIRISFCLMKREWQKRLYFLKSKMLNLPSQVVERCPRWILNSQGLLLFRQPFMDCCKMTDSDGYFTNSNQSKSNFNQKDWAPFRRYGWILYTTNVQPYRVFSISPWQLKLLFP